MSKELIERLRNYELSSEYVCATEEAADLIESQARKIEDLKDIIQRPDRKELQADGKHPAPCAKFCEATAFGIDERRMKHEIKELRAALVEAVDAFEIAVKLNSFREFNDYIPVMKVLLTRCKEVLPCS